MLYKLYTLFAMCACYDKDFPFAGDFSELQGKILPVRSYDLV